MECDMHSFYSAGGVVTFLRISVPWIHGNGKIKLIESSCRLLSHNSVCVYKSKERYGRGKSLSTLHFYCPPINIYMLHGAGKLA